MLRTVVLPSGDVVSREAFDVLVDLETRGFRLRVDRGRLGVAPGRYLTPDDRRAIQRHLAALRLLIQDAERVQ